MDYSILVDNDKAFLDEFLEEYLKVGFGRMNKTDFEFLLMHLFMRNAKFREMSNFDVSLLLKIPESRVRRLKYEAELRYGNHENAHDDLITQLIQCRAEYSNENIKFSIENKFTQALLVSELKKTVNSFADYSFNPEIVTISKGAFADFLEKEYSVEVAKDFRDEHILRNEGESDYHYWIRTALERTAPIRTILSAIATAIQTASALNAMIP